MIDANGPLIFPTGRAGQAVGWETDGKREGPDVPVRMGPLFVDIHLVGVMADRQRAVILSTIWKRSSPHPSFHRPALLHSLTHLSHGGIDSWGHGDVPSPAQPNKPPQRHHCLPLRVVRMGFYRPGRRRSSPLHPYRLKTTTQTTRPLTLSPDL
jgi:hypothetical protein